MDTGRFARGISKHNISQKGDPRTPHVVQTKGFMRDILNNSLCEATSLITAECSMRCNALPQLGVARGDVSYNGSSPRRQLCARLPDWRSKTSATSPRANS